MKQRDLDHDPEMRRTDIEIELLGLARVARQSRGNPPKYDVIHEAIDRELDDLDKLNRNW
ncbi:hypothetical protein ACIBHX_46495 [Nonomuraea sp. NPDC050536]|uniref:hypothetical protein n=1 Tax=Nonomuraea sp. NPDC050536 TaxID=3364366 RepID=UPI0037C8169B